MTRWPIDESDGAFAGLDDRHTVVNCGGCGRVLLGTKQPYLDLNVCGKWPPTITATLPDPACPGHRMPVCPTCWAGCRRRDIAGRTDRRRAGVALGDPSPWLENAVRELEDANLTDPAG